MNEDGNGFFLYLCDRRSADRKAFIASRAVAGGSIGTCQRRPLTIAVT